MKNSDFQKLNIVTADHDLVWCYCPFHKDIRRPNLSISLADEYYGKYKCWACGKEGRLTNTQMSLLKLSNIPYKNNKEHLLTRWKSFSKDCYNNLQKFPLIKLGLAKELNVSTKSLDDWLVGFDGQSFTIPMFREDLSEYARDNGFCGVQRRFPDGSKRCVKGSHLGYMYPYPLFNYENYIFICEGFSDGISVHDLGLPCMSRPNCNYKDGIIDWLGAWDDEDCVVTIIPDNDDVGMEGARSLHRELDDYFYCNIFSFNGARDIREYIAKVGKGQAKKELLRMI